MKSAKMIRIIDCLINNEIVKFEDDYGQTVTIYRGTGDFHEMSTMNRNNEVLSSTYFNRYEEDGGDIRLYWDNHIVGMIFPERLNVPSESIYS
jgi:hypothetical protein